MPAHMELSTIRAVASLLCLLLTVGVIASGPDSIGREFEYTLSDGINGTINLIGAVSSDILCEVASGNHVRQFDIKSKEVRLIEVSGSFYITCADDIIATLRVGHAISNLLPVDVLGTEYTAITDDGLAITATETATELEIYASPEANGVVQVDGRGHNASTKVKLDKGESFFVNSSSRLAGTQVKSNKPVSVLNGGVCLPPHSTWGKEYLLTTHDASLQYKVIGKTWCRVNERTIQLPAMNLKLDASGLVTCGSSVLIGLFMADALVTILPSVGQFPNTLNLHVPGQHSVYHLYIQVNKTLKDEILINNIPIDAFSSQKASRWIYNGFIQLHYEVSNGTYNVYSKRPTTGLYGYITDERGNLTAISPLRMPSTGDYCTRTGEAKANDGLDNDCDGRVDEELINSIDDDGDGLVDEDMASNEFYGDLRRSWPLSYTVLLVVLLLVLLSVLVAICHWRCQLCKCIPEVKEDSMDAMVTSVNSSSSAPPRYTFTGSRSGFTISRR